MNWIRRIALCFILLVSAITLIAQQPAWEWASQSAADPIAYYSSNWILNIATDSQSNLIFAGGSNKHIFLDDFMLYPLGTTWPDNQYTYIWKQDAMSNTLFYKKIDSISLTIREIYCDGNNNIFLWADIYDPSTFEGNLYYPANGRLLIKMDSLGNTIWVRQHIVGKLAVSTDGNCYICGFYTGTKIIGGQTLTSSGREDMFIAKLDQNGDWQWGKSYGLSFADEQCFQVVPLPNGQCFIAGSAPNQTNFDGISLNWTNGGLFVAKLNNNGVCTWIKGIGGNFASIAAVDVNTLYLYYSIHHDNYQPDSGIYVKKITPGGLQWETLLHIPEPTDVRKREMCIDAQGKLYISAYYYDPFTLGAFVLPWDSGEVIFKMDSDGTILWAYDHGDCEMYHHPQYYDICVSNQGVTYAAFANYAYEPVFVQPFYTYPGRGGFALKLSTTGQAEWLCSNWVSTIGTEAMDISRNNQSDNSFVCGNFEGDSFWDYTYLRNKGSGGKDIYVTRFGSNNKATWTATAGGEADQEVSAIYTDADLCSYVTGKFSGTMLLGDISIQSAGAEDIFVAKLDADGSWLWAFAAGGSGSDIGWDLLCDADGNLYVCGEFSGTADFGSLSLSAAGEKDAFLIKLDELGECQSAWASALVPWDGAKALALDSINRIWLGTTVKTNDVQQHIVLQRFNTDLGQIDSISSSVGEHAAVAGLALDAANNCYLLGTYFDDFSIGELSLIDQNAISLFVTKISSDMQGAWINYATSDYPLIPKAIVADATGKCYIAGSIKDGGQFGSATANPWGEYDALEAMINSSGQWVWAKANGSGQNESSNGIALNPDGLCYVVGRFEGGLRMGNTTLQPMNHYESFYGELNYSSEAPQDTQVSPPQNSLTAYPNPFGKNVSISYELKEPEACELTIYNLKGQKVKSYQPNAKPSGKQVFTWDGKDNHQNDCAAGVYLLKLQGTKTHQLIRILKLLQ